MHHLKHLFGKGRFYIYIGFAALFETERNYMLPNTSAYKSILRKTKKELDFIEPETDHKNIVLEHLSKEDMDKLKKITKKQILEVQNLSNIKGSTVPYTCSILGLGAITYFYQPTFCGLFVSSYLTLLFLDFLKSLSVVKYGIEPLWEWQMKDLGFVMTSAFGFFTLAVLTKVGLTKLKERATK